MDPSEVDTRHQILKISLELFAKQGAQHTSVREIAEHLGLSKAAVLYHFETKAQILAELALPLLDAMDGAIARFNSHTATPHAVAEALLEVYLQHREILSLVIQNISIASQDPMFLRWMTTTMRAQELIAGSDAGIGEKVMAIQLTALLGDPVILLTATPTATLRREIMTGVDRYLSKHKRAVGRPPVVDAALLEQAKRLRAELSVHEIAKRLGISRATLYRYLVS